MQETLYDALLTAREIREEWERYDTYSLHRQLAILPYIQCMIV